MTVQETAPVRPTPAMPAATIRVLIVDDHRIFSDLLGFAIGVEPDLEWVGRAGSAAEGIRMARDLEPDVVVMDLQLGSSGTAGIAATQAIVAERPQARVLVLTALKDHHLAMRAAEAGAVGFLQKDGALRSVIHALRAAHSGLVLIAPELLAEMGRMLPEPEVHSPTLTRREREVLELMHEGMNLPAIAARLQISPHTARSHVTNLIHKVGAQTQLGALVNARRLGLLDADPGR